MPTSSAYSRFLNNLFNQEELIEEIFESLVGQCYELLPGFGKHLALDGKVIDSHSRGRSKAAGKDGRRDLDADCGVKEYKGMREDGTLWEKLAIWFGYKLHLLIDADYELPLAFSVTTAFCSEITQAHLLVETLADKRPQILEAAEYFSADRGYDDGKLIGKLWDTYSIKAVIGIRDLWRDKEKPGL